MLVQQHELTRSIDSITTNLRPYIRRAATRLGEANPENGQILCDFITAELTEKNIADSTREWKIKVLTWLSAIFRHSKSFRSMTKQDILLYLNTLRKPIEKDPQQRWIGTYNNRVLVFTKFFRWLYHPDEPDYKKRTTPPCMNGVKQLPRKSKTPYEPSDLWTAAEHDLFLRYCPLKRDKCYHAMARDSSARPHELLKLRIGDIHLKIEPSSRRQYAEILVSGKTKTRTLPLIDSLPYLKEWLLQHPAHDNPDSPLFITLSDKNHGCQLTPNSLLKQYKEQYRKEYFPRLLNNPSVSINDKQTIKGMMGKPWNLYVFRHSALTEKAQILKEATLRDHAGWTMTSKMPAVYIHFFGAESSRSLLQARGIITKENQESNLPQSKICPNCSEPNTPHSKFCSKCSMVLTYDAYVEANSTNFRKELDEMKRELEQAKEAYQQAAYQAYNEEYEKESLAEEVAKLRRKPYPGYTHP